jgi:hypothetical protein
MLMLGFCLRLFTAEMNLDFCLRLFTAGILNLGFCLRLFTAEILIPDTTAVVWIRATLEYRRY